MNHLCSPSMETNSRNVTHQHISAHVLALLQELTFLLKVLSDSGKSGSIDIHSLPLTPYDYERLKNVLGVGEITAKVDALGISDIVETEIPGIWWIKHYNANDEIIAELIEVTPIPQILKTPRQQLSESCNLLKAKMSQKEMLS